MKKLISLWCCFLVFSVTYGQRAKSVDLSIQSEKFLVARDVINQLYVHDINDEHLVEGAIKGMLSQLDPYSTYQTAIEVEMYNQLAEGKFFGIGIEYRVVNDTLIVVNTMPDGPAEREGVLYGDRIYKIDGQNIPTDNVDLYSLLQGPKNSKVILDIHRPGGNQFFKIYLKRGKVFLNSVSTSFIFQDTIGYIHLHQFSKTTSKDLEIALKSLLKSNITSIILDLRDNSGGLLNAAIDVSNEFLTAKQDIVSAKGDKIDIGSFKAKGNGSFQVGKLVLLVNSKSASASEIVAGAIQDWDRGIVVGERTLGKGLVQRPINLPDKSRINLTIAYYFTPSGRCIQNPFQYKNAGNNSLDSLVAVQNQSDSFYTLVKRRPVYGGGGIMPDIVLDKNSRLDNEDNTYNLLDSLLLSNSLSTYFNKNAHNFQEKYVNDVDRFIREFNVEETFLAKIVSDISKQQQVVLSKNDTEKVFIYLKAMLGKRIWGVDAFYKIYAPIDPYINTALQVLKG